MAAKHLNEFDGFGLITDAVVELRELLEERLIAELVYLSSEAQI